MIDKEDILKLEEKYGEIDFSHAGEKSVANFAINNTKDKIVEVSELYRTKYFILVQTNS